MFFSLLISAASVALGQADKFNQPIDRAAPGHADQAVGAKILAEFRQAGIAGDYWLAFELRVIPRQGDERTVAGHLWGMRGPSGPVSRIKVGGENWLIESGPQPEAWTLDTSGEALPVGAGQSLGDTGLTIFDLQMPFLYWTDFTYEGQARVRGRPTHSFILRPPPGFTPPRPGLSGVRVLIDAQFQAMVQAEILGAKGVVEKSIVLLDLKKVGEQWLVKTIDVRETKNRGKTRLTITAAALGLALPTEAFAAGNLRTNPPTVPPDKIVRF